MLLKLDALIVPRWTFAPGRGQLGDGLSRNPEDRDKVRLQIEETSHLPKTLDEAFETVAKCRLDGGLIDDAEDATAPVIGIASTSEVPDVTPPIWTALKTTTQ